jgi:hypothetical protein
MKLWFCGVCFGVFGGGGLTAFVFVKGDLFGVLILGAGNIMEIPAKIYGINMAPAA